LRPWGTSMRLAPAAVLCLIAASAQGATGAPGPQIFAPGTISGIASEDCFSMTPDGALAAYDIANGSSSTIVLSHKVKGVWSAPAIAPFSGQWYDHDPAISPDG